jgi:hypothetical protein
VCDYEAVLCLRTRNVHVIAGQMYLRGHANVNTAILCKRHQEYEFRPTVLDTATCGKLHKDHKQLQL